MGLAGAIDLFEYRFWLVVAFATVLLVPLERPTARRVGFAAVNVVMLRLLFGGDHLERVGIVLATVAGVAWGVGAARRFPIAKWVIGGALAAVPLLVMRGDLGVGGPAIDTSAAAFRLVSYSYVALRIVEMVRGTDAETPPVGVIDAVNYLIPFHMLAAGPIQSFLDFRRAAEAPYARPTLESTVSAVERIAFGLFKKFVLAMSIERVALTDFEAGPMYTFFELQLRFVWLYLDFSGYSDVAVGVGRLMGVATPENFDRPFLARNLSEFWERWHISFSDWLRRNLFLPLQTSLVRALPSVSPLVSSSVSLAVTFFFAAAWHRIDVRYLWWGLLHAGGVVAVQVYREILTRRLGRKGVKAYLERPVVRWIARILTFEYVALSLYPLYTR